MNSITAPLPRFAVATLAGAAAIALLTFGAQKAELNLSASGSLYLLVVVVVSIVSGFWEATVISLLAVACLDYFFTPPALTFYVADPQNWIALGTFEATALIVSRLSARARIQALTESRHRFLFEKLYELSRRILLLDRRRAPGPLVVPLIAEVFRLDAVALFDAAEGQMDATESCPADLEEMARGAYFNGRSQSDAEARQWQRVLLLGTRSLGAIVLSGGDIDAPTADAIASLAGIAVERARSFDAESRAEAARQSEQLRASVLDALAHAFKTPLTAIRTASSGLLETGHFVGVDAEMVTLIDQEVERLNQLASQLLQTARMDAGAVRIKPAPVPVRDLIDEVVAEHKEQLRGHDLRLSVEPADLTMRADRRMVADAIGQVVDNAAKYSQSATPIDITAAESDGEIIVSVHNEGSTIRPADRSRIFERFYRAEDAKHSAPGTGLGLSIAKRTAEAHSGRVWVTSEPSQGTTFFFALPKEGS
jgi:two-component system sensor histidine kinase KdpD